MKAGFDFDSRPWPGNYGGVFLGRVLNRIVALTPISERGEDNENVRSRIAEAMATGELELRVGPVEDESGFTTWVGAAEHTIEEWKTALNSFTILREDTRPWLTPKQRRIGKKPHWIFVTQETVTWLVDSLKQQPIVGASPSSFAPDTPLSAKPKVGRTPSVDWSLVENEVFRLMDEHGEFLPGDKEWDSQARLEEAIERFLETTYRRKSPSISTIRRHVRPALQRWKEERAKLT
jgi:hypothetical protein